MEKIVINLTGDKDAFKSLGTAMDAIIKKAGDVGSAWKKVSDNIVTQSKTSTAALDKMKLSVEQLTAAMKSMDKAVIGGAYQEYLKKIQAELKETGKSVDAYVENTKKAEKGTKTLSDQFKEAKDGLEKLKAAGKEGSKEFDNLKEKAGGLGNEIEALDTLIKNVGTDTKTIDGLISLTTGLSSGFNVAKGAVELFGGSTEELEKGLAKVNAAMAILEGLQQINNVLQKESAAMVMLSAAGTKALALGQQFLAVTTLKTAAATFVLRTALIASGIGILIAVIGGVAAAMDSMGSSAEDAEGDMESLNKAAEEYYESYKKISEVSRSHLDRDIKIVKNEEQIKNLEQEKGSLEEIAALKKENLTLAIQNLEVELVGLEKAKSMAGDKTLFTRRELEIKAEIYRKTQESGRIDKQLSADALAASQKKTEELLKQAQLIAKSNSALAEADVARKKLAVVKEDVDSIKSIKDVSNAEIDAIEKKKIEELKANDLTEGERKKITLEADLKIAEEKQRLKEEILNIEKAGINANLLLAQKGSIEEYNLKIQYINKEQEIQLNATKLTEQQIAEINAQSQVQRIEAEKAFKQAQLEEQISFDNAALDKFGITEQERLKITLKRIEEQRKLELDQSDGSPGKTAEINAKFDKEAREAKKASIDETLAQDLRALEVYGNAQTKANQRILASEYSTLDQKIAASKRLLETEIKRYDVEKNALDDKLKKELITQEEYNLSITELNNKRADATIEAEKRVTEVTAKEIQKRMDNATAVLEFFQKSMSSTMDTSAITTAIQGIQNLGLTVAKTFINLNARIKSIQDSTEVGLDKEKEKHDARIESYKAVAAAAITTTQEIVTQVFADAAAARQQQLNDTLAQLQEQKSKELDNRNLTEQQKADIEKKYKEKERQEKIKAFKADKEAKRTQAIINGALGIGLAFATNAWPYSIIVAALIAASTAVQIAKINSQPVPKFKTGKIDIDGPGTTTSDSIHAMISRGESVIAAKSTAKWKDALVAINNDTFEDYLKKKLYGFTFPVMPASYKSTSTNNLQIDYEKLATTIADKLPEPTYVQNIFDKEGHRTLIRTANNVTEFKNKRYSMS